MNLFNEKTQERGSMSNIINFEEYANTQFDKSIKDEIRAFITNHADVAESFQDVITAETERERAIAALMLIFVTKTNERMDTVQEYADYAEQLLKGKNNPN